MIAAFAAMQHGLVTLVQLLSAGLVHSQISRRVASGRLHRVHTGVYAVGHEVLSREALWHAAVLGAGEGAALSHVTAAELHGITRHRSSLIAVVSPRLRTLDGVRVRRYRTLDPRDVTTHRGIPVTTVHRTFVDLSDLRTPHQLANVIHEAAFKGRFVEAAVRDSMERANGRHHLHVLQRAITLYNKGSAGTKSGPEDAFLLIQPFNPEPLVNTELHGFEVDFHWPDLELVVEIDGPGHTRPTTRRDDARKDRALKAAGYEVLRFTDTDVEEHPERVVAALTARRPTPSSSCATPPA
jgi:hypothetical protein